MGEGRHDSRWGALHRRIRFRGVGLCAHSRRQMTGSRRFGAGVCRETHADAACSVPEARRTGVAATRWTVARAARPAWGRAVTIPASTRCDRRILLRRRKDQVAEHRDVPSVGTVASPTIWAGASIRDSVATEALATRWTGRSEDRSARSSHPVEHGSGRVARHCERCENRGSLHGRGRFGRRGRGGLGARPMVGAAGSAVGGAFS